MFRDSLFSFKVILKKFFNLKIGDKFYVHSSGKEEIITHINYRSIQCGKYRFVYFVILNKNDQGVIMEYSPFDADFSTVDI